MERECGPSGAQVRVCCLRFERSSPPRGLRLLGVTAAFLLAAGSCSGSSSSSSRHSLRYFYMALSEPGQGLPQFSIVGYLDKQPFTRYDSVTRRYVPLVPWMEKVGEKDPQYWERNTQSSQRAESVFRGNLLKLRERFSQQNSTGLHTLQQMVGCEVGLDGRLRGGYHQYAYDGEDFLAFDKGTVSWIASVPQAEISKKKLDEQLALSHRHKDYLEGTCVEWLQRYLGYGCETLLRTEQPTVRVSHKKGYNGWEILSCQLYGFYPKEIEVTWMKDGEDRMMDTWTGGVVPNSDGTYHTWLSIDVDPKEKDCYWCRVGHDSLPEPLELPWKEPASNLGLIVGVPVGVVLAAILLGIAGVVVYMRKRRKNYEAVSKKRPLEDGIKEPPEKRPLEDGIKEPPEKRPPEDLHIAMPKDGQQRPDSFSSGGSSQSCDASDGYSDPRSDSTKAPV